MSSFNPKSDTPSTDSEAAQQVAYQEASKGSKGDQVVTESDYDATPHPHSRSDTGEAHVDGWGGTSNGKGGATVSKIHSDD